MRLRGRVALLTARTLIAVAFAGDSIASPTTTLRAGVFKTAVAAFGHTLLVLAPWQDPVVLTRSWCLWEIYCILEFLGLGLDRCLRWFTRV